MDSRCIILMYYTNVFVYYIEQFALHSCQFVVKNTGDYTVQAKNADALVEWDLVEQVVCLFC